MSRRLARDPDTALIRAASRRMAWQIAVACVAVVVVVAVLTFVVGPLLHPGNAAYAASGDDDDALLRDGLLVAGSVGILVAGFGRLPRSASGGRTAAESPCAASRFVADAGHELRTPLAVVHTSAQLPSAGSHRMIHHVRWPINCSSTPAPSARSSRRC